MPRFTSALTTVHNTLYARVAALISPIPLRAGVAQGTMPYARFNDENEQQLETDKTSSVSGLRYDFTIYSHDYDEAKAAGTDIVNDLTQNDITVSGFGSLSFSLSLFRPLPTENDEDNPPVYGFLVSVTAQAS